MLDILTAYNIGLYWFMFFWVFFVPIAALLTFSAFYFTAKRKNKLSIFQLGKYGVVGVFNTMFFSGIYNFLIFITDIASGLAIDLFFAIGFIIVVASSLFWNKYWVFEEKKTETLKFEAFKFFIVSAAVALINALILHTIVNIIGAPFGVDEKIWANVGLGVVIITATLGNFLGYKYIVFKK